jgi:hypothetical protein
MPIKGGGGSSRKKLSESNSGPMSTIFIGAIIFDVVCFQAISDAVSRSVSGCFGKPRGPVEPRSDVVMKRKVNPEIIKRMMNFFRDIRIKHSVAEASYETYIIMLSIRQSIALFQGLKHYVLLTGS